MFMPLHLERADKLVLLPMNDCTNPDLPSGGSHWTLLVQVNGEKLFHIDSSIGSNASGAQYMHMNVNDVARKLKTLQGKIP